MGMLLLTEYAQAQVFRGVVRDAATGEPIPGVSIQQLATPRGTRTNRDGDFTLYDLSAGSNSFRVSSVG